MEKHIELGIIDGVDAGMRDCNYPVLWFDVKTLGGGSLQVFSWEEAEQLIKDADVRSISQLNRMACEVEICGNLVHFIRIIKE